jgi:hypothetical protein
MSLATLQRSLQAHITGTLPPPEPTAESLIAPTALRGLPVYGHAYGATLTEALRDTFEKTALWLGDEAFDEAAREYIRQNPSRSWTLADYGAALPEMLAAHYPDDPEIAELAWLDWDLRQAFAAAAAAGRPDADALQAIDWEAARFDFAPHVTCRATRTNVAAIWNGIAEDMAVAVEILSEQAGVLVWREGLSPQFRSCPGFERAILEMLRTGERFGPACAQSGASPDQIGAALAQWLADGLISVIG